MIHFFFGSPSDILMTAGKLVCSMFTRGSNVIKIFSHQSRQSELSRRTDRQVLSSYCQVMMASIYVLKKIKPKPKAVTLQYHVKAVTGLHFHNSIAVYVTGNFLWPPLT